MEEQGTTLIGAKEAAERLGISLGRLRHLCADRRVPFVRIGRSVRFAPQHLEAWVRANTVKPTGSPWWPRRDSRAERARP